MLRLIAHRRIAVYGKARFSVLIEHKRLKEYCVNCRQNVRTIAAMSRLSTGCDVLPYNVAIDTLTFSPYDNTAGGSHDDSHATGRRT